MLSNPKKITFRKSHVRRFIASTRNAGVVSYGKTPNSHGIRFMNTSSAIAALLVFFFGTILSIISGEYTILVFAIPETALFWGVIFLNSTRRWYGLAVCLWHFTFCTSTCVFGILQKEVIDAMTMAPFLILAPWVVLWKSPKRKLYLPICLGLSVIAIAILEVGKEYQFMPPLPLHGYYWYFRPATYATVILLDIIIVISLFLELDRSNRKEKQISQELKSYTQILAHELRTPLSSLKDVAYSIKSAGNSPDELSLIRSRLDSSINYGLTVIGNAQALARIDANKSPAIVYQNFSIQDLVSEQISIMKDEAERRELILNLHTTPLVPAMINSDPDAIRQVLTNLISNAFKFSQKGKQVRVTLMSDTETFSIEVADSGIGIKPENIPKVFEKYYSTNERNPNGTGIGLYISSKFARFMGGRLTVKSKYEEGTTFTLSLPLRPLSDLKALWQLEMFPDIKVLVVDDSENYATGLANGFAKLGCQIAVAFSGAEALETAISFDPDFILLDKHLPDIDAYDLIRDFRAIPHLVHTAVAIFSGDQPCNEDLEHYGNSIVAYRVKPVAPAQFREILSGLRKKPV